MIDVKSDCTDVVAFNSDSKEGVDAKLCHWLYTVTIAMMLLIALVRLHESKLRPKSKGLQRTVKMSLGEVLKEKVLKPKKTFLVLDGCHTIIELYSLLLASTEQPRKSSPTQIGRASNLIKL